MSCHFVTLNNMLSQCVQLITSHEFVNNGGFIESLEQTCVRSYQS